MNTNRLAYLDGLRGVAALYVVAHHAFMFVGAMRPNDWTWLVWLMHGNEAVAVFIVLSGICLMQPSTVDEGGNLRYGLVGFAYRRARRILPPYYAAMCLCLLLTAIIPELQHPSGSRWDGALPVFSPGVILSHLLLVHNFSPDKWMWKIDPPMWSIATEWQIYAVFAVILLPLWKRYGSVASIAAAAVIVSTIFIWLPSLTPARPEFVFYFTAGMIAARDAGKVGRVPLISCAPLATLGNFSYSLYLVHFPVLAILHQSLSLMDLVPAVHMACMLTGGILASLLVAYGFHILFERPFMSSIRKREAMHPNTPASKPVRC